MAVSSEMHNDLASAFLKEQFLLLLHADLIRIFFENKATLLTNFFPAVKVRGSGHFLIYHVIIKD